MSTAEKVILVIGAILGVAALLLLVWAATSDRKTKRARRRAAVEQALVNFWTGMRRPAHLAVDEDWDPITRTYAHGCDELDQIHAIDREQRTVTPWPTRQTPDSFDHIREDPWTPVIPGRTPPRYQPAGRHAAPEPTHWQAMPEYGEGRGELVVVDAPVSPAGAHAVPVVVTARPRHDGTQRMFGPEYDELARAILNEATGAYPVLVAA